MSTDHVDSYATDVVEGRVPIGKEMTDADVKPSDPFAEFDGGVQ
jgi:hypothetical protein